MRCRPVAVLTTALLLSLGGAGAPLPAAAAAAETPPAKVAPSATVTDTVEEALAAEDLQRAVLARLEQAGQWRDLAERVALLETELDALAASATAKAELINPIDLDRQLRSLHRAGTTAVGDLATISRRLEHDGNALESEARKWQERRVFLESQGVPAPVLERDRKSTRLNSSHPDCSL
jgi:hypothetical protein